MISYIVQSISLKGIKIPFLMKGRTENHVDVAYSMISVSNKFCQATCTLGMGNYDQEYTVQEQYYACSQNKF